MRDHRCSVSGCKVRKGLPCPHMAARCPGCKGSHYAQANVCKVKREAQALARSWRPPPPACREKGAQAPDSKDETAEFPVMGGEMEVEVEAGSEGKGKGEAGEEEVEEEMEE